MKRNKKKLCVEDLMSTAVIALRETATVETIQREMSLADVRHMPIVDENNHVIGIVSERDVLRALPAHNARALLAAEIMTRRVRTVRPDTLAADAAGLLRDHKFGSVPVIGDDEQLVGILTDSDFLELARNALLQA